MSGSLQPLPTASQSVTGKGAGVAPVTAGYFPVEGSRVIPCVFNWTAQTGYQDDLSQAVAVGELTSIQTVIIDNSANSQPVTLISPGTGNSIICPANSQGIFPIMFSGAPLYQVSVPAVLSGAYTRVMFLNIPLSPAVWAGAAPGSLAAISPVLDGGKLSALGLAASTQVKVGAGRVASVTVNVVTAVGTITLNDAAATGTVTAANTIATIPIGATVGTIYTLNFPFANGLAVNFNGGATGTVSVSYT